MVTVKRSILNFLVETAKSLLRFAKCSLNNVSKRLAHPLCRQENNRQIREQKGSHKQKDALTIPASRSKSRSFGTDCQKKLKKKKKTLIIDMVIHRSRVYPSFSNCTAPAALKTKRMKEVSYSIQMFQDTAK